MQIGVVYPQIELRGDPTAVRRIGRAVEDLGFDHLLAYDHVLGAVHADRTPELMKVVSMQVPCAAVHRQYPPDSRALISGACQSAVPAGDLGIGMAVTVLVKSAPAMMTPRPHGPGDQSIRWWMGPTADSPGASPILTGINYRATRSLTGDAILIAIELGRIPGSPTCSGAAPAARAASQLA